ncbi:uncharacterized protein BX663DRAFT_551301 [Cokeromyces recurvatus]|uniref:uncharacterized protein n=1 Tax=Cokeromyces recurvatus TaxID=90255 RepID=UPI002221270B|nr:uncharacterized protein BX663DRAFT_551301 [Cokeromyces recurvatus]KAI7903602.1 hypothetical protein BX663DRAFT_551301 [Cokeromyces recurvatus]
MQLQGENKSWKSKKVEQHKDKLLIISFGNREYSGKDTMEFKGLQTGVIEVLWNQLKCRQKCGDLQLVFVDEFRALKTCHSCSKMLFT